jgi:hypothetical protein
MEYETGKSHKYNTLCRACEAEKLYRAERKYDIVRCENELSAIFKTGL